MATNDIKGKVIDLLGGLPAEQERKRKKKRAAVKVSGRGNVVGVGDHVHIKHQVIERPLIQPDASCVSAGQARQIQNAVEHLVDIDEAAGVLNGDRPKLFARWYRAIKDRYEVPSYRVIPAGKADDVLAWLARTAEAERSHLSADGLKRLAEIEARHHQPGKG